MALRQQQVVLIVTGAMLGLLLWSGSDGGARQGRARPGRPPQFQSYPALDVSRAEPAPRASRASARDVFSPPRDTQPLPPLALQLPPLPRITALAPPGLPGPAVPGYARWLRGDPTPVPVEGLFITEQEDLADDELLEGSEGLSELLVESTAGKRSEILLSPDERAALVESWKSLYDWIRVDVGEPLFGRVANTDRFGLSERPQEAILFTQIDPRTGAERFPGMPPVKYERERVAQFAFADTVSNRIQSRRREFLREMSASRYDDLMIFAVQCVAWRLEAREALDVAAEMFTLAEPFADGDPGPRLGLARCHEAAFRFEEAYQVYLDLLASHAHRAEVHVGLAQLEARLRLFESAEERFRLAESQDRLAWRVQWAFGRFLLERGRWSEALAHLEIAWKAEPVDPELKAVRGGLRSDLARAQLATGAVEVALATFESALSADASQPQARAGRLNCLRLLGRADAEEIASAAKSEQASFEVLLDAGLAAMVAGEASSARDLLQQAAAADPLNAHAAWGALSWLAETTGYAEDAFRFVEAACEADPQDAWSAYQRGRLLMARDDLAGAREALLHALDLELDFPDAMIALAQLAWRSGEHRPADLYLERALSRDPDRPEVHAVRGTGLLLLGEEAQAAQSFEAALKLDPSEPLAALGQAWLAYRRGDSERAIRLYAEVDDRRRALPEDEPYRAYAQAQIARLRDHESKVVWSDLFERRELRNDWQTEEGVGPLVDLADGMLRIQGDFRENGLTRVVREYAAPDFVAVELSLTVRSQNNARVGLFVSKERRRGAGQTETQGEIAVARRKDGGLVVRLEDRAAAEPQWEDVPPLGDGPWWPADQTVRVRIERSGEGSAAVGRIVVDGVTVAEGFSMRALSSSSSALRVGVFVEGQTGLPAAVTVDDVEVVYRVVK